MYQGKKCSLALEKMSFGGRDVFCVTEEKWDENLGKERSPY